jgi:hypothetical protein
MMKRVIWMLVGLLGVMVVGCRGGSGLVVKINPYNKQMGYVAFEEKTLLQKAVLQIGRQIAAAMPTSKSTKLWLLSLDRRHDKKYAKMARDVMRVGFLRRGLWQGGKGAPLALKKKPGMLKMLSKAAALTKDANKNEKNVWLSLPPKDPFLETLFLAMLRYGNSDNIANTVVEDNLVWALIKVARTSVLERDRDLMITLAAHYFVAGKLLHHADPSLLKQKLLLPDKILAYRITMLRKELFTEDERASAGAPNRRVNRIRHLWVQLYFRLVDVATGKIEWVRSLSTRVDNSLRPTD